MVGMTGGRFLAMRVRFEGVKRTLHMALEWTRNRYLYLFFFLWRG